MLITVQRDLFEHLAPHGTGTAAEIAELHARNRGDQAMEQPAACAFEPAADARPAMPDHEGRRLELIDECRNLRPFDLEVGGHGENDVAARVLETHHQRTGFAE